MEKESVKILIVDDDEKSLKLLEARLLILGFKNVITAADGAQALNLAQKEDPDLIFLDIMMPGMDGARVKAKLNENPVTRDIPVVFLTAIVTKEEVKEREGIVAGFPYIAKPYDTAELGEVIHKVIGIG